MSKSILFASGTKSASGDNELIAAPTGNQKIVIVLADIQNESAVDTTVILKAGATAIKRRLLKTASSLFVVSNNDEDRVRLPVNTALNLNLSAAHSVGYSVQYFIE